MSQLQQGPPDSASLAMLSPLSERQAVLRLAVLPDFAEEQWPSMDLCAEMLLAHLGEDVAGTRVAPRFRRAAQRLPFVGRRRAAFNSDRLLNRLVIYPRHVRRLADHFDAFHVVDHSYAHLVHHLPAARTGVCCHDLDAFRSVIEPRREQRPAWFRALVRHQLAAMRSAAIVFHDSRLIGEELLRFGLVDPERLVYAPLGVTPEFVAAASAGVPAPTWLQPLAGRPWVLHVGSCIPRKRVDVLLEAVAAARRQLPELQLVKVGGEWATEHREQIERLQLDSAIIHRTNVPREELAAAYQQAPLVLTTSEAEGFGLPVIEALACGARVLASDIPILHEVGGEVISYAAVGAVEMWSERIVSLISEHDRPDERSSRLKWASQYTWMNHAQIVAAAYRRILTK